MSELFEATAIGDLQLANRFVRSATWLGMADQEGAVTPRLADTMVELAQGGVGLILTGYAYVQRDGQAVPFQMGCCDDRLLPGLTHMVGAVHDAGGKIALQIAHGGLLASPELTGQEVIGPSPMPTENGPLGRAMTPDEIEAMVEAFGSAASRAVEAGFDAIEIHAAHGYLLSQFLSPFFNKRTDSYGGCAANRARMLLHVVERVQDRVGDGLPILVKVNSVDMLEGGLSSTQMLEVCAMLQDAGVDAIEMSGGTVLGFAMDMPQITFSPVGQAKVYWREAAEQYKEAIGLPLILVGGVRSLEMAQSLLAESIADYVSLCRPLIREPNLVARWQEGDTREAACISENACLWAGVEGKGVRCVHVQQ